ncbi:hypothetical protein [Lentzea sp. NPDC004782]|uniref:hypothetical protein n=1 Tax=Lentzea sp. NPDC004782 TaxID=3154458 RepID=UPI0033AC7183
MSGGLEVFGDAISQSGEQLTGTAERLTGEIAAFSGKLAGFGNPFGGDDLGSTMQMIYGAIADAAMECFGDNTATMSETGGKLVEMGAEYVSVEERNHGLISGLLGRLDG